MQLIKIVGGGGIIVGITTDHTLTAVLDVATLKMSPFLPILAASMRIRGLL